MILTLAVQEPSVGTRSMQLELRYQYFRVYLARKVRKYCLSIKLYIVQIYLFFAAL